MNTTKQLCVLLWWCVWAALGLDLVSYRFNGSVGLEGRNAYFIFNGTRYKLPDRYTTIAYGNWEPDPMSLEQAALPKGEDLVSRYNKNTPATDVLELSSSNNGLVIETALVVYGISQFAMLYQGAPHFRWILKMTQEKQVGPVGRYGPPFRGEYLFRYLLVDMTSKGGYDQFRIGNTTSMSKNLTLALQFIRDNFDDYTGSAPNVPFIDEYGVEPRYIELENGRVFSYYSKHTNGPASHYFVELLFPKPGSDEKFRFGNKFRIAIHTQHHKHDSPYLHLRGTQKNWAPFSHDNQIYFVSHIWPFNVVKVDLPEKVGSTRTTYAHPLGYGNSSIGGPVLNPNGWVISMGQDFDTPKPMSWRDWISHLYCPNQDPNWKKPPYDVARSVHGSSQGVKLFNGEYIAFFHAYDGYGEDGIMQTYTIGAYTWKTVKASKGDMRRRRGFGKDDKDEIRFQLTAMSPAPIIPTNEHCVTGNCNDFYKDRWLHDHRLYGYCDYLMYPMSITVEGDYVFVNVGYQLLYNYVLKFKIDSLLQSLQKLNVQEQKPLLKKPCIHQ